MSAQKNINSFSILELKKILQSLNTFYNVEATDDSTDLFAQGLLDSLILIQFVMAIENSYKIQIKNQDITYENFKTFSTVKSILDSNYAS